MVDCTSTGNFMHFTFSFNLPENLCSCSRVPRCGNKSALMSAHAHSALPSCTSSLSVGTPPMSESRRRSYSMSSRPRPFKSTPSPPHTKPKPSRPPPPSKLSAPGSKSSHPQSPSHNSPSAGAAKTTTSLPRGMKPSAILPQGGRRPYSKSIGDVHAKKGAVYI